MNGSTHFIGTNVNNQVETFLGIPYAQPPVGALRFARPLPVSYTAGTFVQQSFGNACPQLGHFGGVRPLDLIISRVPYRKPLACTDTVT